MYAWQFAKMNAIAKQRNSLHSAPLLSLLSHSSLSPIPSFDLLSFHSIPIVLVFFLHRSMTFPDVGGWTQFVSMQNHYNLVYREEEREMNPYCMSAPHFADLLTFIAHGIYDGIGLSEGIGLLPWSPLARGFLAGNRKAGEEAKRIENKSSSPATSTSSSSSDSKTPSSSSSSTIRAATDSFAHTMYYQADDFVVVERVKTIADKYRVMNSNHSMCQSPLSSSSLRE